MMQQEATIDRETPADLDPHVDTPAAGRRVGFGSILANAAFTRLWAAQILSQVAQNTVFASMLAQIQFVTGSSTNVVFVIASGLLPQVLLSSFAGVLVDRTSKRAVLTASNILRALCVVGYLNFQTSPSILFAMVFCSQAIGQFFAPAEAAAIPTLVRRDDLMAATSLFNLSFNIAQVLPFGLGLLLLSFIGLTKLLLIVIALFLIATLLVATLPNRTAVRPRRRDRLNVAAEAGRVILEFRDGVRFIARDRALRLALIQINITPTVMFLFGVLGAGYVQRVIHLRPDNLYVLLVPAGLGLLIGTWGLGQYGGRLRKEQLSTSESLLLALPWLRWVSCRQSFAHSTIGRT
jgi:MFS family permease